MLTWADSYATTATSVALPYTKRPYKEIDWEAAIVGAMC